MPVNFRDHRVSVAILHGHLALGVYKLADAEMRTKEVGNATCHRSRGTMAEV